MVIGVTGNIGSGKSTVAGLLAEKIGASIVDADALGHYLQERNPDIQKLLLQEFGPDIVDSERNISRRKLSDIVFSDMMAFERLNTIFYPYITYEVKMGILRAQKMFRHVILDAALILEWGMKRDLDKLVVVTCPAEIRLRRLMERRRLLEDEAEKRINAQAGEEYKIDAADILIKNDGSLEELETRVDEAAKALTLKEVP